MNIDYGAIEEIAYLHGFINKEHVIEVSKKFGKSGCGDYIL